MTESENKSRTSQIILRSDWHNPIQLFKFNDKNAQPNGIFIGRKSELNKLVNEITSKSQGAVVLKFKMSHSMRNYGDETND